jgi:hypothetical protein
MFYTIHRCLKLLVLSAFVWVAWKLYERREVVEPAWVWADVWDNGGFNTPEPNTVGGRVTKVVNSQTFIMAPKKGMRFNVRLLALRPPASELTIEAMEREKLRREALEDLILNKWVHVELHYSKDNNIGGIVFCEGTNINATLVQRRLASSTRDLVKGLPKESQYSMLWAMRHRPPQP